MVATRLTQRRVDNLRPRKSVRNVRDAELKGYGVRITPSGTKRYFIHSQHRGHRVWKIVGNAAVMTEAEARTRARSMLAALRDDRDIEADVSGNVLFETVAEEVFSRYGRRWKPRTLAVNRYYLQRQILPFFTGWPIAEIDREEVQRWFRSLHATPAAANRSAPILSVIMQQAEAWGYRPDDGNPCRDIRRYRQKRSERFLSPKEYDRLGMVLDRHEARQPFRVAALRLLLLTGCRKSEIVTLRWSEVDGDVLRLAEAKTGLRTVWLSEAAQAIIAHQSRNGSAYVFPSPRGPERPQSSNLGFWRRARREAGIKDVRLHDLRHTVASQAVANGVPLPTVAKMLGHTQPTMTLRYTHVGDREVEDAAERIGATIAGTMHGQVF